MNDDGFGWWLWVVTWACLQAYRTKNVRYHIIGPFYNLISIALSSELFRAAVDGWTLEKRGGQVTMILLYKQNGEKQVKTIKCMQHEQTRKNAMYWLVKQQEKNYSPGRCYDRASLMREDEDALCTVCTSNKNANQCFYVNGQLRWVYWLGKHFLKIERSKKEMRNVVIGRGRVC